MQQLHGFTPIVRQPTRDGNVLDQIYVSDPLVYDGVRVVKSVVNRDHMAVVAYTEWGKVTPANFSTRASYRRVTPGQHAAFLEYVKDVDFTCFPIQILSRLHLTISMVSH